MGSKPQAPTPPDPVKTSQAQTASNVDTARASAQLAAVNSSSPYGSVSYSSSPSDTNVGGANIPQYTQTTTFSPEQQALYNRTTGLEGQALDTANTSFTNAQGSLGQPFGFGNVPNLQTSIGGGNIQGGYNATDPQFGIAPGGNIQNGFANPRSIADAASPTGAQTSLGYSGPIASAAGPTGQQTGIGYSGPIQGQIDRSNLPGLPGANDFSAERQRVEDAYLGRFNTDIVNQQNNTESRLNAQGLQQGSEAWNQAQDSLNRERVDARNTAIQAGGAEQSRLFGLASQARGQMFGENQAAGNFANTAQNQAFGQNLAGGQFTNSALNNLYSQLSGSVNQANAGQAQAFGQSLAGGQFANQGLAQQYAQGSNYTDQANNAQNQAYLQSLGQSQFANQAQGQQFGQNQAMADFYNQAAQQQTANAQGQAAFGNAAQQQGFGQNQANVALNNQGRQQGISEAQLLRSQPINELATLLGLGSNVQTPTGAPNFGVQVNPTDVLGAYGMQMAGQNNAYNQQIGAQNAIWGALGNLGGAAGSAMIMKSDARLKIVIRQIGNTLSGLPIYLYRWKKNGELAIGVLAQEVEKIIPDAVREIRGVKHVDYARIG